jgi:hypothetical protein
MTEKLTLKLFIEHKREGEYFTLPFQMPPGIESLALSYRYERHREDEIALGSGDFVTIEEVNIIDLGLIAPDGAQVGASGSDKSEIILSETSATPGYKPWPLVPGQWGILVGAYLIAKGGVEVTYELSMSFKSLRLFKGDLHAHTLASDGLLTAAELGQVALRHGLDFLAITDHNQMVTADALPVVPGLTLIPGVEWTHYRGHAHFLGVDKPYDPPFATNTLEEVRFRFESARQRGALITINHPREGVLGFSFPLDALPFDCLEVWNGPMRESNLHALALWQSLLEAGNKVPICGGSDFHREGPFQFLGGPTTCVFAMSSGPSDILDALRAGHAYITFAPDGPSVVLRAGEAIMGDSVPWPEVSELHIAVRGLRAGDILRVVTAQGSQSLLEAPAAGRFSIAYPVQGPGFARVEVLRAFLPGIPKIPALVSNPIYFDSLPVNYPHA